MTTEQLPPFDAQAEYLNEQALLSLPEKGFATTMKHGYIIDDVDLWSANAYEHVQNLVNRYNDLAYRAGQITEGLASEVDRLNAENEQLRNALEQASNAPAAVAAPAVTEAPDYTEDDEYPLDDDEVFEEDYAVAAVEEEPEAVEETLASADLPAAVAPPVNEVVFASERAQQILNAAAKEASDHVTRALQNVARIEAEAQEEADEIVTDANAKAGDILSSANAEAETIKASAVTDAADALATLEAARNEKAALFERVVAFHAFELEKAHELLGTVTPAEETASEEQEDLVVAPVESDEEYVVAVSAVDADELSAELAEAEGYEAETEAIDTVSVADYSFDDESTATETYDFDEDGEEEETLALEVPVEEVAEEEETPAFLQEEIVEETTEFEGEKPEDYRY